MVEVRSWSEIGHWRYKHMGDCMFDTGDTTESVVLDGSVEMYPV